MDWAMQILARMLADPTRYGEMVIKVQAGQIVHVHESQDHKPPKKIDKTRLSCHKLK